jgi:uncharacterized protein (TIGR02147 family)
MTNIFLYEDFREFLRDELKRRALRNAKYSLRAFARDIGISFSRLSETLSSTSGISQASGQVIAQKLKMTYIEREYFLNLIIARHGRTAERRRQARHLISEYKAKKIFICLRENQKEFLLKWYYVPLVELLAIKKPNEISKILGISEEEVVASALLLAEMGQIVRNDYGTWRKINTFQKIESHTPTTVIRQFHRDVLRRGVAAIETQPIEKRKYLSSYFCIRKEDVAEARNDLERMNQEFLKKYTTPKEADAVYVFSVQLFELNERNHEKKLS